MNKTRHTILLTRLILALSLFAVSLSACSQTPTPTATQMPEPTLASLPDGDLVYGDPGGRFSLPLVGDWTPVETDGSYGHFRLAEPILDAYVVAVESEDLDAVAETALAQIGLDTSALSQPAIIRELRWTAYMYALDSGRGVTLVARRLGGATIAVIFSGESSVTTAPLAEVFLPTLDRLAPSDLRMVQMSRNPAEVFLTLDGLALMPLADYLEFQPPPAPSTVEDIENLNTIEFYSGRTKLVGRLTLPEGEGPFPAIVYTGWGSGRTTRSQFSPNYMRRAGLAVFSYDKRGAGDSEGVFVEAGLYTGEWRLPQLADDALAAVAFLQGLEEINPDQIGLMGESQNGWTIPLAAAKSDAVAFTVIIAGPTVSIGEELYWSQIAGDADRISKSKLEELSESMAAFDGPHGFDPRQSIEAMSSPGLWIWGDRDGSIPVRECKAILESIIEEYDKDFSILYDPEAGHDVTENRSEVVDWIHLDDPVHVQYWYWMVGRKDDATGEIRGGVLRGDLGWSNVGQGSVAEVIGRRLPATAELALCAAVPMIGIGIWLGVLSAVHHNKWIDQVLRVFSIVGWSIPTFVFGLVVLMIFYARLHWFPPERLSDWASRIVQSDAFTRYTQMNTIDSLLNLRFDIFLDSLRHLVLPVVTLAYLNWAYMLRITRSSMLDTLRQDYITTARSKGLAERVVIRRHALSNALIPVVTVGGLILVGLLNGVVITETIFSYPGMGSFLADAAMSLDVISVLGITLTGSIILVAGNLLVDVLYGFIDPRTAIPGLGLFTPHLHCV